MSHRKSITDNCLGVVRASMRECIVWASLFMLSLLPTIFLSWESGWHPFVILFFSTFSVVLLLVLFRALRRKIIVTDTHLIYIPVIGRKRIVAYDEVQKIVSKQNHMRYATSVVYTLWAKDKRQFTFLDGSPDFDKLLGAVWHKCKITPKYEDKKA